MQTKPLLRPGPPSLSLEGIPSYEYSHLDTSQLGQIRLLKLLPGHGKNPLICEIIHANISDAAQLPVYEALSYCWGRDPPAYYIQVDGKKYHVRENLCWALYYLRLNAGPRSRYLWIDAICIDQESNSDRNHQVAQMGNIYKSAAKVIAWLGLQSHESSLAFDVFRDPSCFIFQHPGIKQGIESSEQSSVEALLLLCRREYWLRLWIAQEIVLARDVELHCGSDSCSWDVFRAALTSIAWLRPSPAFRIVQSRDNKADRSLFILLKNFVRQLCKYRRDKIYGLLGMASDIQNGDLVIDYSKKDHEVWYDVLCCHVSNSYRIESNTFLPFAALTRAILNFSVESPSEWAHLNGKLFAVRMMDAGRVQELGTPIIFEEEGVHGAWLDQYRVINEDDTKTDALNSIWGSEYPGIEQARTDFSYYRRRPWLFSSTKSYALINHITSSQNAILSRAPHEPWEWNPESKSLPRLCRTTSGHWSVAPPGLYKNSDWATAIFLHQKPDGTFKPIGKGTCEKALVDQILEESLEDDVELFLNSQTMYEIVSDPFTGSTARDFWYIGYVGPYSLPVADST